MFRNIRKLNLILGSVHFHHSAKLSSENVIVLDKSQARWITLNNPKHRNILTVDVLKKLKQGLDITITDSPIRCVVIQAEGNVFSGGHDLKELAVANKESHKYLFDLCSDVMLTIRNLQVPVIAKVKGHAAAAGCQLVASCDIVVAAETAKFSTPGINVGLFCSTPGIALVRAVPRKVASYMLHTGLPITAQEASYYGLVSRLVPEDQLDSETERIVSVIVDKSGPAQELGKQFFNQQLTMSAAKAYSEGAVVMTENLKLKDTQDGISSFAKKETPRFKHSSEKAY